MIAHDGWTPPCFAVALEACFPDNVWPYSPSVIRLGAPLKVSVANNRVAEKAVQKILADDYQWTALVISEPGNTSENNAVDFAYCKLQKK